MKKIFANILALAVAGIATTQANSYVDVDQIGVLLSGGSNNRYLGVFDIVNGDGDTGISIGAPYANPALGPFSDIAGFRPGSEKVDSAYVAFFFRDNDDSKIEEVRIGLDNTYFTGSTPWGLNNQTFTILGGEASGAIQALEVDGVLRYNIIRTAGDFYFDYAILGVEAHVPDAGSTVALLGIGLLGMGAIRRKLA